jgi:tetratricopeptide (TPR) repeat protein
LPPPHGFSSADPKPLELSATPFFPQREFHCGPAALAMALAASGINTTPDAIAPALYIPERQGTLQVELVAAARQFDRLAVPIDPTQEALLTQLQLGRPVVVLQNLLLEAVPRWHYAVVVGYLPAEDAFVLRSGRQQRLVTPRSRFLATWIRAKRWGVVIMAPGSKPEGLSAPSWLQAAAALESAGNHEAALTAFDSALSAWPEDAMAWLGRGNNLYALGNKTAAINAWSTALRLDPDDPVPLHNLVTTLADTGAACKALSQLPPERAGEHALVVAARKHVNDALSRASRGNSRGCPHPVP